MDDARTKDVVPRPHPVGGRPSIDGDPVVPDYYRKGGLDLRTIVRAYGLNHNEACAVKYILRHRDKGEGEQDLQKSIRYITFEIEESYPPLPTPQPPPLMWSR